MTSNVDPNQEPVSGQTGNTEAGEPYDAGNKDENLSSSKSPTGPSKSTTTEFSNDPSGDASTEDRPSKPQADDDSSHGKPPKAPSDSTTTEFSNDPSGDASTGHKPSKPQTDDDSGNGQTKKGDTKHHTSGEDGGPRDISKTGPILPGDGEKYIPGQTPLNGVPEKQQHLDHKGDNHDQNSQGKTGGNQHTAPNEHTEGGHDDGTGGKPKLTDKIKAKIHHNK